MHIFFSKFQGTTLRYEDLQDQKRSEREDGKSVFKDDDSEDDEDVVELSKGNFFLISRKKPSKLCYFATATTTYFFSYFIQEMKTGKN